MLGMTTDTGKTLSLPLVSLRFFVPVMRPGKKMMWHKFNRVSGVPFPIFLPYCCTSQAIVDVVWLVAPFDWEMVPKPTRTRLTRGAVSYPYGWGENARWQGEGFFMNFLWQKKVDEAKWMWVIWLNGVSLINHALGNLCKLYDVCCVHSTFPVYECLL